MCLSNSIILLDMMIIAHCIPRLRVVVLLRSIIMCVWQILNGQVVNHTRFRAINPNCFKLLRSRHDLWVSQDSCLRTLTYGSSANYTKDRYGFKLLKSTRDLGGPNYFIGLHLWLLVGIHYRRLRECPDWHESKAAICLVWLLPILAK